MCRLHHRGQRQVIDRVPYGHFELLLLVRWQGSRASESVDLESTEAVEAQKQWPFDRVAQACDVPKPRESGATHHLAHCLPGGNGLHDILL